MTDIPVFLPSNASGGTYSNTILSMSPVMQDKGQQLDVTRGCRFTLPTKWPNVKNTFSLLWCIDWHRAHPRHKDKCMHTSVSCDTPWEDRGEEQGHENTRLTFAYQRKGICTVLIRMRHSCRAATRIVVLMSQNVHQW